MKTKNTTIKALQKFLPKEDILSTKQQLMPYESDALTAIKQIPWLVVLPNNEKQLHAIVTYCQQQNIAIIPRGAGTGLSGGARPTDQAIVISMAKFKQILKIDVQNKTVTVQPGVRNLAISQAVQRYNLYYAPDPSSQIACTIGGNVAENAGGVHCLKYGLTVHNVLAVKMMLADGEIIELGGYLESSGYDLLALVHGSEGLLGIITEITVKLLLKPEKTQVIMASFSRIRDAGNAVNEIISKGIIPAGLEIMDKLTISAVSQFIDAGYPETAEAILICEIDGLEASVDETIKQTQAILSNLATSIQVSESEAQRIKIWSGRKNAFPAMGRISPDYYVMDGTIPRRHLGGVLEQIERLSAQYQLRVANVFHAGDGNLHPLILYDANIPLALEKAETLGTEILKICVDVGGTITGEHGVGIEKLDAMCHQFPNKSLQVFHQIKQVFDPEKRLNPGKAVPSLHRCAELGAMHVHKGQLPHPDLERF